MASKGDEGRPGAQGGEDREPSSSMASALRKAGPYLGIGWSFVVPMLLGLAIGSYLDRRFGWDPWAKLALLLLGMGLGFMSFFRLVLAPPRGGSGRSGPGEGR